MKFIVRCSKFLSHTSFWTSVPVTTYWDRVSGKMVHVEDGKVWQPDENDDWFCQECGNDAVTMTLDRSRYAHDDWVCPGCLTGFADQDLNSPGLKCPHCDVMVRDAGEYAIYSEDSVSEGK